jgi:type IV pilus assembly protein PilQ
MIVKPASSDSAGGTKSNEGSFLSSVGRVTTDERTNQAFIFDIPSKLEMINGLLKQIDRPERQVLIEARIVETTSNFGKELGVRMNLFNTKPVGVASISNNPLLMSGGLSTAGAMSATGRMASSTFTQATTMGNLAFSLFNSNLTRVLSLELDAMELDGKGRRLSNPRILTGNNLKAHIKQGARIPISVPPTPPATANTVAYVDALLALEVTPQITPDGQVYMKLLINNDKPDWTHTVLGNPLIQKAESETNVLIENGGTLVIGGVNASEDTEQTDRIPFLGDLPYIGFMFKHKNIVRTTNELMILITPRIVESSIGAL